MKEHGATDESPMQPVTQCSLSLKGHERAALYYCIINNRSVIIIIQLNKIQLVQLEVQIFDETLNNHNYVK